MRFLAAILAILLTVAPLAAQETSRLDLGASSLVKTGRAWWGNPPLELRLALTRAVPYRTFIVGDPTRLIVDLKGVDFALAKPSDLFGSDLATGIRWGRHRSGWSRAVIELPGPYRIATAVLHTTTPQPQMVISLVPISESEFSPPPSATAALRDLPNPAEVPVLPPDEDLTIVLDPGHGGFDPGAEAEGQTEADLVLTFALELKEALTERGVKVVMTRDDDNFVRLEQRMTTARTARADLFMSLHADALPQGQAAGATVYVWNRAQDRRASEQLIQRHDRDDLVGGVDLLGQDDDLAAALMAFARTDTQSRSENFARWLTSRMALMGIDLHGRPVQSAVFSVLKSPDIPSVLLELGFISDERDRANLSDPLWRARMVEVLCEAVVGWAQDEAARKATLRR